MEIESESNFPLKSQFFSEKVICPKCNETTKVIIKDNLLKSNGISFQPKIKTIPEFYNINCSNCEYTFTFIFCAFCEGKIFMKINPSSNKYNGLIGFNIRCPYKSCNKVFYFSECPKCIRINKIKQYMSEESIITCTNETCQFQYILFNCPHESCGDIRWTPRPKIMTNFPSGLFIPHNNEKLYQKITCIKCHRPICFSSTKEKSNRYYEGQKITCPYSDCGKAFNRLICSFCSSVNYIDEGWYEYGTEIKCTLCKGNFGKLLCTSCGELSSCKEKFLKYGETICGMDNCRKANNLINCLYCRQINIMKNKVSLYGRRIKCGYCFKSFCKITCPHCSEINRFPYGNFFFGKVYKCQYFNCYKEFQILICSKCFTYTAITHKKEGQKYQCEKCGTAYMNIGCKFCKLNILFQDCRDFKIGSLIQCPNSSCRKVFSFMQCYKCEKLIYSDENECIYGTSKQCLSCQEHTAMILCPICNKRVVYNSRNSLEENEITKCKNCKKNYPFHRSDKKSQEKLQILEELEGKAFNFGKAEIDENFLMKEKLFFTKNNIGETNEEELMYNNGQKTMNFGACIICHNKKRESVFFPCGHRCTCYEHAIIIFNSEKKCPKCKTEIICVIRKVHE